MESNHGYLYSGPVEVLSERRVVSSEPNLGAASEALKSEEKTK